ncbi:MAG: glycosyltransferase family 10 [Burkholderiaceae bacterium]
MRHATLVVNRLRGNEPFRPGAGPNGGDFFLPWRQLRARFATAGVELNTRDLNADREVAFELHLNAQRRVDHPRSYAYLYEDPVVRPINGDRAALARYRRVFTSNEELIDEMHALRLDYPNDLAPRPVPGFGARDLFCVLIASNKALLHPHPRNLHHRRVEAIRFFERHAPDRFALFGHGWDIPPVAPGVGGRLMKRLHEWKRRWKPGAPPFPSFRGAIGRKAAVLDRARFSICYENSRGSPGYVSEKIFDCLTSGCVPVYIGTTHRAPPVPADCFIDGDAFDEPQAMLAFLDSVDAGRFDAYQGAIRRFLASPAALRFTNAHWCETLVTRILADVAIAEGR